MEEIYIHQASFSTPLGFGVMVVAFLLGFETLISYYTLLPRVLIITNVGKYKCKGRDFSRCSVCITKVYKNNKLGEHNIMCYYNNQKVLLEDIFCSLHTQGNNMDVFPPQLPTANAV